MKFDISAARSSGYSDDEIAEYLAQEKNFDLATALESGYTPAEVVGFLSEAPKISDTGDETARLAARYPAPEKPGIIDRITGALPLPIRVMRAGLDAVANSDTAKSIVGAGVSATASAPKGLEDAARGAARRSMNAENTLSDFNPTMGFSPSESPEQIYGQETAKEKSQRALGTERALASAPSIPGAKALADYGEKVRKEIEASRSPEAKKAIKESEITGNIFKGEIDFGSNPNAQGYFYQAVGVLGSMAPMVLATVATKSPTVGGLTGGASAAAEGARSAQEAIAKMSDEQLAQASPFFRQMVEGGANPQEARDLTARKASESAAILQGIVATFGDKFTAKLITDGLGKTALKVAGKSTAARVAVGTGLSAGEQGAQEVAEGVAADTGLATALPNTEIGKDSAGNLVLGALGGLGPGAFSGARGQEDDPKEIAARELAAALEGGQFTEAGIAADVATGVRTGGMSNTIAPTATVNFTPADSPSAQAGLAPIVVPVPTGVPDVSTVDGTGSPITVGGLQPGDLGGAGLGTAGLAGTVGQPGGTGAAGVAPLAGQTGVVPDGASQQPAGLSRPLQRATDADLLSRTEANLAAQENNNADNRRLVEPWFGRAGGGYTTIGDAQQALPGRERKFPSLDWRIQQMPNGKFMLAGYEFNNQETTLGAQTSQTQQAEAQGQAAPAASAKQLGDLNLPQGPLPDADVARLGSNPQSGAVRTTVQQKLNQWAANTGNTAPQLGTPDAEAATGVNVLGALFGEATGIGQKVVAYSNPGGENGFTYAGFAFVNTAPDVDVSAPRTALHEVKHVIERIAEADTKAGRANTPAQKFVAQVDSIFDDMTETGKRAYVEKFLNKEELDSIADPAAREARLQELIAAPKTRSEMVADFMGNRAQDRAFLIDLAKQDPQGFEGFVKKWLSVIDNLIGKLRGLPKQSRQESAKVDQYVRDLNKAKMVARDALIEFRKGNLAEQQGQQQDADGAPVASAKQVDPSAGSETRVGKVDTHVLNVARGERTTSDKTQLSAEEKVAVRTAAKKMKETIGDVEELVRDAKAAHPVQDGWAALTFTGAKVNEDTGKFELQYKTIPYQFNLGAKGASLDPASAEYTAKVGLMAQGMLREVRNVYDRAQAGDEAAAKIIAQSGWYKEMRTRLRQEFGGLGDLFADLLGATSPNTPVRTNWDNSVEALRLATTGQFDELLPRWLAWSQGVQQAETKFRAFFDAKLKAGMKKNAIKNLPEYQALQAETRAAREFSDDMLPLKSNGKKFGFNGQNVARAMVDLWRVVQNADPDIGRGGTAPKAINFSGNLIGFRSRATIDVWAARMLQRLAGGLRIPSMAEGGVSGDALEDGRNTLQFGFGQDVFSSAVNLIRRDPELSQDDVLRSINDDDLQALVWFIEKEVWTKGNWTSAAGEGGSFEFESDLAGVQDREQVRELRKVADSSVASTQEQRDRADADIVRLRTEAAALPGIVDSQAVLDRNAQEMSADKAAPKGQKLSKLRKEEIKQENAAARVAMKKAKGGKAYKEIQSAINKAKAVLKKPTTEARQEMRAEALGKLGSMARTVDRFTVGLSLQQNGSTTQPTDSEMAELAESMVDAVTAGDSGATVIAVKAMSSKGLYGAPERALDAEFIVTAGFDARPLAVATFTAAEKASQDAAFVARVLRPDEKFNPLLHRPGIEIYFRDMNQAAEAARIMAAVLGERTGVATDAGPAFADNLLRVGKISDAGPSYFEIGGYTIVVDGRPTAATKAGKMGVPVGMRVIYMPEFEARYGMDPRFTSGEKYNIGDIIQERAEDLGTFARKVLTTFDGVSFAGRFNYEVDTRFAGEYQGAIDAYTNSATGEGADRGRSQVWQGRPVAASIAAAVGRVPVDGAGQGGAVSGGYDSSPALSKRQRNGGGRGQGRSLAPLEGAPSVPGFNGPDPRLVAVAEQYARENGITLKRQAKYVEVDLDLAKRIAAEWERVVDDPNDPATKKSYAALAKQTRAQYEALAKAGYRFWFQDMRRQDNQDYAASPWNAMRDIRATQTMGVFPTTDGYGNEFKDSLANQSPLLEDTGLRWPSGSLDGPLQPVLFNDLFRAVHDAFGHGLEGAGFRAQGEENAWQAHARLFTGDAIAALTSETRGQNSWLNYGPYGEANQTAQVQDVVFAEQKTGLMPEWTWTEGVVGDMPAMSAKQPALQDRAGLSRLAYQGYEKAEVPKVQAARKLAGLIKKLDEGKITPQSFELQVRLLSERMDDVVAAKDANKIVSERQRGADIVREKLIAARRRGEVDFDTTEFALWLLQKNPALANGLGITVKEQPEGSDAAGDYNPASSVMRVFKGVSNADTGVHEILHHTERMMPPELQTGIRNEWAKQYAKALIDSEGAVRAALEQIPDAMAGNQLAMNVVSQSFADGVLKVDEHYQLVNPSEFWAVNATDIMRGRYDADSWIGKAKQWLAEMLEKVKGMLGARSNAAVLKGLKAVMDGKGELLSKKMLSDVAGFFNQPATSGTAAPETPEFKRWFGDSMVVDEQGNPQVMYHGSYRDLEGGFFNRLKSTEWRRVSMDTVGNWFSDNPSNDGGAGMYASGEDARIYPVYLRIERPKVYTTFKDFLREMHEAEGRKFEDQNPPGLGSTEGLRTRLKAQGYDGIAFLKTDNQALMDEIEEYRDAVSRARKEELSTPKSERSAFTAKRERLEQKLKSLGAELAAFSGSTEFDKQYVWITFEPTQIKSAIGNVGTYGQRPVTADEAAGMGMTEGEANEAQGRGDIRFSKKSIPRQKLSGINFEIPAMTSRDAGRRVIQDDALRMKRVLEAVKGQGGTVGEAQNFYEANTLMPGRIQAAMDDFRDNVMTPLIDKAVAADIDLDELALYAYAKHARERNAYIASINPRLPDGGSGMKNADAAQILADVAAGPKAAEFDALHKDLMAITATTRQLMLNEGLITQDEFDAMENAYANYIPLRGLENVDESTGAARPGVGRGINVQGKETIRALGRRSRASDLIENAIRDYQRVITRVEKNDVAKVLLDFVLSNPDPDLWGVDIERTKAKFNEKLGLVQYTKYIENDENTIGVKVGGKQVYIQLADQDLTRALRQAWKDETSGLERVTLAATGWWNNWMRAVLTRYNPAFAAINIPRDALWSGTTAALAELGPKGLARYTAAYGKALMASGRKEAGVAGTNSIFGNPAMDRMFEEFRSAGGITGGFYMRGLDEITTDLRNDMLQAGAKAKNPLEAVKALPPYKLAKGTLKALEFIGSASENATRFALYIAARESGKTPQQAALLAKDGTTNFNRKGEWGGALNNLYLFFNAAVQGTAQLGKVLKNRNVQVAMAGVAGVGAMLALYGASAGGEDDDGEAYWDKIPSYVKERNLVIMLPPGGPLLDGMERVGKRGRYITIPVQYGFNIFPNAGYMMADVFRNVQDPRRGVTPTKAALHMTSVTLGSINPFGGAVDVSDGVQVLLAAMPTLADLPIQIITERGTFGTPSAPEKSSWDMRPDSERMFTSQMDTVPQKIAKALNELGGGNEAKPGRIMGIETSVAPGTIKTLISATTGGLGSFADQVATSIMAMSGSDKDLKAASTPFLNKFYGEVDEGANIGKAGDRMREVRKQVGEIEAQFKLGLDPKIGTDEQRMLTLADAGKQYQDATSKMRKDEIAIIKGDMPEPQKKLLRQQIQVERDKLATSVNRIYLDSLKQQK